MEITADEYFFFEWLIIEKKMTSETFELLSNEQFDALKLEWAAFMKGVNHA